MLRPTTLAVHSVCVLMVPLSSAIAGTYQHPPFDPAVHLTLGQDYPAIVRLYAGSGVLIDPLWVLTAAHVAKTPDTSILIGLHYYTVAEVIPYPDYVNWSPPDDPDRRFAGVDLALFRLAEPVSPSDAVPAVRYRGMSEQYHVAAIVGFGRYGTGLEGYIHDSDGQRRAGRNVIDEYGNTYDSTWSASLLIADFDDPDDPSKSITGEQEPNPLEFHPVRGDSGGGWFIGIDGERQLAGITAFLYPCDSDPGTICGVYGELAAATRISFYNSWIDVYTTYEKRWKWTVGGLFESDGNWDYKSPLPYQAAVFDVAGTYTISMPGATTNRELRVVGAEVSLAGTYLYTVTQSTTTTLGGTLSIASNGQLTTGDLFVGDSGAGTLVQDGGTITVENNTYMGVSGGSVGQLQLRGGTFHVMGSFIGDGAGTSEVIIDGGTLTVDGDTTLKTLTIGHDAVTYGIYDITGGSVESENMVVGRDGRGHVTQIGGNNRVSNTLAIGLGSGGDGDYTLAGGALYVDTIIIGPVGHGAFSWTAGDIFPYTPGGTVSIVVYCPTGVFQHLPDLPTHVHVSYLGCILDTDGDGVPDEFDLCPSTISGSPVDETGCPPLIPGDFDRDGDVGASDCDAFVSCASGPAVALAGGCEGKDLDGDGDVDQSDFGIFQRCLSGEDVPGDPNCAQTSPPPPSGMVLICAGEFMMGDQSVPYDGGTNERPDHAVWVDDFYMDRYEVTKELWDTVRAWGLSNGYSDLTAGNGWGTNHPVHSVNWFECVKWANARSQKESRTPCYYTNAGLTMVYKTGQLVEPYVKWDANGYRLPTEAEWEKAARGGVSGRRFPWSNSDSIQHVRANYYSSSSASYDDSLTRGYHLTFNTGSTPYTSPVGYFASNGCGLYDMAGNVWEWCNDWHDSTYYSHSPYNNPRGPTSPSYRVARGGAWNHYASECRVATRSCAGPNGSADNLGFRCAAAAP